MKWFKRKTEKNVRVEIIDNRCWFVLIENGRASMYDPDGRQLYCEISCEITDDCNYDLPRARFDALVNVVTSREQMQDVINGRSKSGVAEIKAG